MARNVYISQCDEKEGGQWCVSPLVDNVSSETIYDLAKCDTQQEAEDFAEKYVKADSEGGLILIENKTTGAITCTRIPKNI